MVRVEGKKQQGKVYDVKDAEEYKCPICKEDLVKLETVAGEPYTKSNKVYYDLYWICLCPKGLGHGKFKVKDTTFKCTWMESD